MTIAVDLVVKQQQQKSKKFVLISLNFSFQLYTDLTDLFSDCPDLLHDFAGFLLPEQAVECDCFLSHQEFFRARTFLRKLEVRILH